MSFALMGLARGGQRDGHPVGQNLQDRPAGPWGAPSMAMGSRAPMASMRSARVNAALSMSVAAARAMRAA